MARGRPRKHNPTIPAHIDQARLPAGLYWDKSGAGRWYVREPHPDGPGTKAVSIAGATARLSELHAIMESRSSGTAAGSVAAVVNAFNGSLAFKSLAPSTKKHYQAYAAAIKAYPVKTGKLGDVTVDRIAPPFIRSLVDRIAEGMPARPPAAKAIPAHPTKANHWLRYLRRAFGWGVEHGVCKTNPAAGVRCVREVRDPRMPERDVFRAVQSFARERGARGVRQKGRHPPYLWAAMELAYQARLRGIEVLTLHDGLIEDLLQDDARLQTNRRKGSRDNLVRVGARMREAIEALQAYRKTVWQREELATPIRAAQRPLFVSEDGTRLTRAGFNTAWGKLMRAAVDAGMLTPAQRFGLHGLKHRGITDTKGTRADRKDASGHITDSMASLYDHSLPTVDAADDA